MSCAPDFCVTDINNIMDKFFYPQSYIMKFFNIPEGFHDLELKDFRNYFWHYDPEKSKITLAKDVSRFGTLVGSFDSIVHQKEVYYYGDLSLILVGKIYEQYHFAVLKSENELNIEDGKFKRKSQGID